MFFRWLDYLGLLCQFFHDLQFAPEHPGGNHHTETVWAHLLAAGDGISPKFPMVKLAGYLHDIGKPGTYDECFQSFIGHHLLGSRIVRRLLTDLKCSNAQVDVVAGLTRCHMHTVLKGSSPKSIRKLIKKLAEYGLTWRDFLRLRIADHKANTRKQSYTISEIKEYVRAFQVEEKVTLNCHNLALSGGEIMELLQIPPGPFIGQLQKKLLEFVLEEGEGVNSRGFLIQKLRELLIGR